MEQYSRSGETEAIVIVKAVPHVGVKHGETVCCAGIDFSGKWLRLFPISFRTLDDGKKFSRWDKIKFKWRLPRDDQRIESHHVDQDSLEIIGKLKEGERENFLSPLIVTSLDKERNKGKSLALLKVRIIDFKIVEREEEEIIKEREKFAFLRAQTDLFNTAPLIPYEPCPFKFKYEYETDDGRREGTCQDWEIEATYYRWSRQYGCNGALERISQRWGKEYPSKGILLAMGTHSRYPDKWLINGVIRLDEIKQLSLSL